MISGIYNWQLLANDNSFYYLWEDYSASQNRIYVQRVFPNGNFYFAENGIPITETTYSSQINYVCKSLPDGGIVAAWNEIKENEDFLRVRLQVLFPDGSFLSPDGIDVTTDVVENQIKPKIDIVDGNIIVVWLEDEQIKAQKLVDFTPAWGANGSVLLSNCDTSTVGLKGNYILFVYQGESHFHQIDESGNLNANWPTYGISIPENTETMQSWDVFESDLVYSWKNSDFGLEDFGFQILASEGSYVFPDNGIEIITDINVSYYDFLFDGCINLFHTANYETDILMERYDLQGQMIWDGSTCYIPNGDGINYIHSVKMGDKFLVVWDAYNFGLPHTFLAQLIDSDGSPIPSTLNGDEFQTCSSYRDYQLASA
nr:hypothetical protein [Candidatus Cloacimonadota bacterium]